MASFLTGNRIQLLQTFDVREDVFLGHPLVPKAIKSRLSQPSFIANRDAPGDDDILEGVTIHIPRDLDTGPTVQEIQNWYGKESSHVLLIHAMSMYRNYQHLNREDILGPSGYAFFGAFLLLSFCIKVCYHCYMNDTSVIAIPNTRPDEVCSQWIIMLTLG